MLDEGTGHRYQENLRENPAVAVVRTFAYPLRGAVTRVAFSDDPTNKTGQTLVDINLLGGRSYLTGVPISVPKANSTSGEEWTPEPGDIVVVQFLNGQWNDPVVTGFMNMPNNEVQATGKKVPAGKRRYHMRCNKTSVEIDKDGNRTVDVVANDTLTVTGDGKISVKGKLEIEVMTGGVTITVKGNATISAANVEVTAATKMSVKTPLLECTGNITAAGTITGAVIADATTTMAASRLLYQAHTHQENGVGGGITSPPIAG